MATAELTGALEEGAAPITKSDTRPYGLLKQTHEDHDAGLIQKLNDLYEGGFKIIKRAGKYLVKCVNEHDERFKERCTTTSYQPYFGQIVDQFTSDVFGQPLAIKPASDAKDPKTPGEYPDADYYTTFEKDVDREGKLFIDLMVEVLRCALKHRCALVAYDAPKNDGDAPASKADEDAKGLRRIYAYSVPIEQLIDWKCKRGGREFQWAILNKIEQERETPDDTRDTITETFTVWTLPDDVGGAAKPRAHWKRYVITYKADDRPEDDVKVPLEDEGDSSFAHIPLLRMELPEGLWVGNKVGPQALEHWQRRSTLVGAEGRSMMAIPYVKKGPEGPAVGGVIPAEITQNPYRGNRPVERFNGEGWVDLGSEDELGFAEPTGRCYELVGKELNELRDAMFAVNHQMAASIRPTGAAVGRSGMSKQKDEDSTERVLRALGHILRQFAVRIYGAISEARGEDVHWAPHGLDGYEHEDREQVLEESISMDQVAIPSPTFRKIHKKVVAAKLLKGNVDPETLTTIFDEIDSGVDDEEDMRQLQTEAQKDALLNPPDPTVGPPKSPSAKAPKATAPKPPAVGQKSA